MVHATVQEKLEAAFPGASVAVMDTSAGHEDHNDLMNLAVTVLWDGFEGMSLIDQHKKIHKVLKEELKTTIHALRIRSGTP
jgi:BolA protein